MEMVKAYVTDRSFELTVLAGSNRDIEREYPFACGYASSLERVLRRINQLIKVVNSLINKLPQ
jgi:hypothetical protein